MRRRSTSNAPGYLDRGSQCPVSPSDCRTAYISAWLVRVAYLSADFRIIRWRRSMADLFERMIARASRSLGYRSARTTGSDTRRPARQSASISSTTFGSKATTRRAGSSGSWRSILLVDVARHTQEARLGILAHGRRRFRSTGSVSAWTSGAGFPRLRPRRSHDLPFDEQTCSTERIVHVPDLYFPPTFDAADPANTPAVRKRGCRKRLRVLLLQQHYKITPMFDVWMRLLRRSTDRCCG